MNDFIWKFELGWRNVTMLAMPANAKILTAQLRDKRICLWVLYSPSNAVQVRKFMIIGTGKEIKHKDIKKENYISTVQDGKYVWHVFEIDKE